MTENTADAVQPENKKQASPAKELVDQGLNELMMTLKKGKSDALLRYLAMLAKFHRYSFSNVLLIWSQCPQATYVAGYQRWKQLRRFVKRGEKGILILAPIVSRKKDDNGKSKESDDDNSEVVVRFRSVYVFDVAQTEGAALAEFAEVKGDPTIYLQRLKDFIAAGGITLNHDDVPSGADGVARKNRIGIREELPPAKKFAVLVHELAHVQLHFGENRPVSKTVRETEAEAVAFVVGRAIGLETNTAASDYIQLYDGKCETLLASLDRIQRVAGEIIVAIADEEDLLSR
ncbi:MAG TPA: ArdC family protein [Terriglobales bacterium]|nr:ArdC family protein [Terriglobales bacterium]